MDMFVKNISLMNEKITINKNTAPGHQRTNDSILSCPGHKRMSQGPIISTEAPAITKPKRRRRVEDLQKTTYQYVSAWAEKTWMAYGSGIFGISPWNRYSTHFSYFL